MTGMFHEDWPTLPQIRNQSRCKRFEEYNGENFEKAGQQALQEREEVLIKEKARLEFIVQILAEDRIVTTIEMIDLQNEVKVFNDLKERYDKELELYKKKTSTTRKRTKKSG